MNAKPYRSWSVISSGSMLYALITTCGTKGTDLFIKIIQGLSNLNFQAQHMDVVHMGGQGQNNMPLLKNWRHKKYMY